MADQRLHSLDAMRGIAAIAVVIFHLTLEVKAPIRPYAYLSVDFFFILSGFVLALAYERRLSTALSPQTFMIMRAIRLYPMFALGGILGAVTLIGQDMFHTEHAMSSINSIISVVANVLALPSPVNKLLFPINAPGWSLSFEFLINALFAFFLRRLTSRRLFFFVCLAAIGFLIAILRYGDAGVGPGWDTAAWGIVRVNFSFCLGMLFARWHRNEQRQSPISVFLLIILTALLLWPITPHLDRAYSIGAVFFALPLLFWLGTKFELPSTLIPVGAVLGDLSYPLYAIHYPLMKLATFAARRLHISEVKSSILFLICIIPLAWWLALKFDEPVRRWLSVKLKLRATAMPVEQS